MTWQLVGFGMTVGWMWLFFLNGPVLAKITEAYPGSGELCFQLFLISSSIGYLGIGRQFASSILVQKRLLVPAALTMSLVPAFYLLIPHFQSSHFSWVPFGLAIVGGISAVMIMLAWLETFTTLPLKKTCVVYAGGIFIASLLLIAGVLWDVNTGITLLFLIPLLTVWILLKYANWNRHLPLSNSIPTADGTPQQVFPRKLVWLIVIFYTAGGLMYKLVSLEYALSDFFWASNLSYLMVVVVAAMILFYAPHLDLRSLYRPALPLLAAGFMLFPFLPAPLMILSFILLQAGFALFDMYTWMVVIYLARRAHRPVAVLGLGMFWILAALFGGNMAFSIITPWIAFNRQPDLLVISAALVTLMASMIFQETKRTFMDWETQSIPTAPAEERNVPDRSSDPTCTKIQPNLTPRETEVLALIIKGRNNPFICEKLSISPNTLKFHLRNIYGKYQVNNRQELLDMLEEEME